MATRRRWFGVLVVCGVATVGCATGNMADPDAEVGFEDVDKKPVEDTGKAPVEDAGEGEDAVVDQDVGSELDAGTMDAGAPDAGELDAGAPDAGAMDAGTPDVGVPDNGIVDTGVIDTGPIDTGPVDTGVIDTGPRDTGVVDTGPPDTGPVDTGGPTITCPLPFGTTTCTGSRACCFNFAGLPAGCGCAQIGGLICLPCN
jgi:hypothetical protein